MQLLKKVLTVALAVLPGLNLFAAGQAKHVVLMVWDGMRPDFISPETTPALWSMAQDGVFFLHHHPVYPSMTEVNATALSTGVYPWQSGMIGNHEFRPAINPFDHINTDDVETIRRGDKISTNHYLAYPTLAEILQRHGLGTVIAGTKPVAILHDRAVRSGKATNITLFAGQTLPEKAAKKLKHELGKFPEPKLGKTEQDAWTTSALLGPLWENGVPAFSLLWMGEPDYSQHKTGPGSKQSLAAIKSSDDNLARVLQALKDRNIFDETDIIVVSDHGFSTIKENLDRPDMLASHGFRAVRKFTSKTKAGDILVVGNGGEVNYYVAGHDKETITRLAHFLQSEPYSGVVFSQLEIPGTFPLSAVAINSPNAPDVAVAMRWTSDPSATGAPGLMFTHGDALQPGQGQHATLGPSDMHNTCVAFGPDFKRGMRDAIPSGNIDIAPTILWLLAVTPGKSMSGRVLSEALMEEAPPVKVFTPRHEEAEWQGPNFVWHQFLDTSEVNGVVYLDEGNGRQSPHNAVTGR